jgi:hypothetical protein
MLHILTDTLLDTVMIVPYLVVIYFILEIFRSRVYRVNMSGGMSDKLGPLVGGLAGIIPQCGIAAAGSTLYLKRLIRGGTLIAILIATSDEAIPVLLSRSFGFGHSHCDHAHGVACDVGSQTTNWELVLMLILTKLIMAIIIGYVLNWTLFRKEQLSAGDRLEVNFSTCEHEEGCHDHRDSILGLFKHSLQHSVKIAAFILVTLLAVNVIVELIGKSTFETLILSGSAAQPFITAAIGIIPGCAISVLLTQLLIAGDLTFGSAIAGLTMSAGIGYLVLFRGRDWGRIFKLLGIMYVCSVGAGLILNLII